MSEQLRLTRAQYQKLYDELNAAHDNLPGNQPKLREEARDRRDEICELLDGFDQDDLLQNTSAFVALKGQVENANQQVRVLQSDIAKISNCVATGEKIAAVFDQACSAASKLFAI